MSSTNNVVYVCCNTYTGKPKRPIRVQGDRRRANEVHKQWKKSPYSRTDRYLNL